MGGWRVGGGGGGRLLLALQRRMQPAMLQTSTAASAGALSRLALPVGASTAGALRHVASSSSGSYAGNGHRLGRRRPRPPSTSSYPRRPQHQQQEREAAAASTPEALRDEMRRCREQGRDLELLHAFRELSWVHKNSDDRGGSSSSSSSSLPIRPEDAAVALEAAQRLGQPRLLERAVEGFLDSYPRSGGGHGGAGKGKGSLEELAGVEWWRPIVAALEAASPNTGRGWRAQWALLQGARKRPWLLGREGEEKLQAQVLGALEHGAAAGAAAGADGDGQAAGALALLLKGEEGARPGDGAGTAAAVLSLIRADGGGLLNEAQALLHQRHQRPGDDTSADDAGLLGPCYLELAQALVRGEGEEGAAPNRALAVLGEMRERGISLPASNSSTSTSSSELTHALLSLTLGHGRANWAAGLDLLAALPQRYGLCPTLRDHALVLRALAGAGRGQEAYALVRRMRGQGQGDGDGDGGVEGGIIPRPDAQCLNFALRACGRMRMGPEAREVMGWLQEAAGHEGQGEGDEEGSEEGALQPSVFSSIQQAQSAYSYSLAIDAAARAGDPDRALALLGEMKARGVAPLPGCYGAAMNALGKAGRLDQVLALLEEMKASQSPRPTAVTYTIAIDACARAHDAATALALLREMEGEQGQRGSSPPPVISYAAAINACAKARDGRGALALVAEMGERGLAANEVVYGTAIHALNLSEEDDAGLLALYDEMRARGLPIASNVYGAAIKACDRSGRFDKAVEVGEAMLQAGLSPLPRAIKCVLRAADRALRYERGLAFFQTVLARGETRPCATGAKLAVNLAAKVGDAPALVTALRLALEAEAVASWMIQLAVSGLAKAELEQEEQQEQQQSGQQHVEALRALVLELKAAAARQGRAPEGEGQGQRRRQQQRSQSPGGQQRRRQQQWERGEGRPVAGWRD